MKIITITYVAEHALSDAADCWILKDSLKKDFLPLGWKSYGEQETMNTQSIRRKN